jgi:putative Mg2+ transporter-C (MgtC) family protein
VAPVSSWRAAKKDGVTELVVSLILATALGAVVGIQRQVAHKPAGLRTHAIVSLGACAFALISHEVGDDRIAAGVITGIGFLGAGAIVRSGLTAHGLTTAASIWAAAAIGLACGSGVPTRYLIAALTTVLTWVLLAFSDFGLVGHLPARRSLAVKVTFDRERVSLAEIVAALRHETVNCRENDVVEYHSADSGRVAVVGFAITFRPGDSIARVLGAIAERPGVLGACVDDAVATS